MIKKIENFLPNIFHNEIKETLTSTSFPWFYMPNCVNPNGVNTPNTYGFSNLIYLKNNSQEVKSSYFNLFYPICYFISDISKLISIRVGMQTKVSDINNFIDEKHLDLPVIHKNLLYYVVSSDGDTLFYNGDNIIMKNTPVENTALLFNGEIYHSSSHPINNAVRIAVSINYI